MPLRYHPAEHAPHSGCDINAPLLAGQATGKEFVGFRL
jgi:hypothetical protein